jgi:cytochrome c peroxidase
LLLLFNFLHFSIFIATKYCLNWPKRNTLLLHLFRFIVRIVYTVKYLQYNYLILLRFIIPCYPFFYEKRMTFRIILFTMTGNSINEYNCGGKTMRHWSLFCMMSVMVCLGAISFAATPLEIRVPKGLPALPVPADNPMTVEKVELGKMLFFDKRLSKDHTLSCATCHIPENGYAEPLATSKGINGQIGTRNSNPVVNSAYATSEFWDGRSPDLEDQAMGPVENPIEMGHDFEQVVLDLKKVPEYVQRFQDVFGSEISKETIAKAIAAFERTLLSGNSPYDQGTMNAKAKAGEKIFKGQGFCATCHTPPLFSNWGFYNAGIGMDKENPDIGRMEITKQESDKGAFRVPHLREATLTGPYYHDGSVETLEEAVRIMATGGIDNPNLHALFRVIKTKNFSDQEIDQLVEFIRALSGEYPIVKEPKLP